MRRYKFSSKWNRESKFIREIFENFNDVILKFNKGVPSLLQGAQKVWKQNSLYFNSPIYSQRIIKIIEAIVIELIEIYLSIRCPCLA